MSDEILQHDRTFKTYFLNAKRTWLFEIVSSSRMLVKEEEGEENTEHKCICICINKKNQCLILTTTICYTQFVSSLLCHSITQTRDPPRFYPLTLKTDTRREISRDNSNINIAHQRQTSNA